MALFNNGKQVQPHQEADLERIQMIAQNVHDRIEAHGGKLRDMFRRWDVNSDGDLNCTEFQKALAATGLVCTEKEISGMMKYLDDDFDGQIQLSEFANLLNTKVNSGGLDIEGRVVLEREKVEQEVMDVQAEGRLNALGQKLRMPGGAFQTANPGQWRNPAQWATQPFPEPLRRFQKSIQQYQDARGTIRDTFRSWDKDKDGFLNFEEFKAGLTKCNPTAVPSDEELQKLFHALDMSDGTFDGLIDFNAFQQLTAPPVFPPCNTVRPDSNKIDGLPILPREMFEQMVKENTKVPPTYDAKGAKEQVCNKLIESGNPKEMFNIFNWNPNPLIPKDGMRKEDFARALGVLNIFIKDKELDKLWVQIDEDGSGELDYYEFLEAFDGNQVPTVLEKEEFEQMTFEDAFNEAEAGNKKPLVRQVQQRLGQIYGSNKRAFRNNKLATENSIRTEDLRALLQTSTFGLSEEEVEQVIGHADQSNDGFIDYAEFCTTLMPQTVDRKGNPMEMLSTGSANWQDKRKSYTHEFGSKVAAGSFGSSFGAAATGGRFGYTPRMDTFSSFQPDPNSCKHMTGVRPDQLTTTSVHGLLPGLGGVFEPQKTDRGFKRLERETKVHNLYSARDAKTDRLKEQRIQNIFNRRTMYVNQLHHDPCNAPKLSQRFMH